MSLGDLLDVLWLTTRKVEGEKGKATKPVGEDVRKSTRAKVKRVVENPTANKKRKE